MRSQPVNGRRSSIARGGILLIAVLALTLATVASPPSATKAARRSAPCPPRGAHVQAADDKIVAYFVHGPDTLFVCDRASGFREQIETPTDYAFPAPAIAVVGNLYAFGDILPGTGEGIRAERLPLDAGTSSSAPLIAGDAIYDAKLITLKLKRDGALAWMTCRINGPLQAYLLTGPHARCQRPGTAIWVYKHDANQEDGALTELAHGNTIDPRSFRLRGSTVSWRQHGRRRTAQLY